MNTFQRVHMGRSLLEIIDSSQFSFYSFFALSIRFLGRNDIKIDQNRYQFLGSFFTLFISWNPQCSDLKNRQFAVRLIQFLTLVHPHFIPNISDLIN